MDRKEFLSNLGVGAAAIICSSCLGGCQPLDTVVGAPTNIDITLDLTASVNSGLIQSGGTLYRDGIVIARTAAGTYIAVSSACTHAGTTVQYEAGGNRFHCPAHGSNFASDGSVINGPANSPLGKYNTTLTGSSLRVFS